MNLQTNTVQNNTAYTATSS